MIVGPAICSKQIVRSDPQITLGTPNWWFWTHSIPPCLFLLPIATQLTYHGTAFVLTRKCVVALGFSVLNAECASSFLFLCMRIHIIRESPFPVIGAHAPSSYLRRAVVALKTVIFMAPQLRRWARTVEAALVSKRNQIRSVFCFECRCRLDISTLEKWLDHVHYWCAMRP